MRNHIIVALRNLRREKVYAAINIAGLALGIACCLILALFLRNELTYDRHHQQHARIYRVVNEFVTGGKADTFAVTSRFLAPLLQADYPQIEAYVRLQRNAGEEGRIMRNGDTAHAWTRSFFADDNVFDVFTHHIIYGDPATALKDQNSVAISETAARTYFGDENPVGRTLTNEDGSTAQITLVFEDLPQNTHLKYDLLFSGNLLKSREPENASMRVRSLWGVNTYTYLLMKPDFDPATWQQVNDEFYERYMAETGRSANGTWKSWLEPLTSIHLHSSVGFDQPRGNAIYLYGCAAVALFILVVACINYMNLSTARATRRARSVGIRKILGASRLSLALQFLGEAVLFSLIALVLGFMLVELAVTFTPIGELLNDQVHLAPLRQPAVLAALFGLAVLMGLLAGAYPAFYLSSWAPLTALTGKATGGKGSLRLREALVLLQFTISAAGIACTLLMAAQMRYVSERPLGFQKENRLIVTLRGVSTVEALPTLRTELLKNPRILGITQTAAKPGTGTTPINMVRIQGEDGNLGTSQISHMPIGEEYLKVMGLELVKGRDFSARLLTDVGTNFIVNETMVRKMGWTEPLGKRLLLGPSEGRVIGVVRDFNYQSLHHEVDQFALYPINNDFSNMPAQVRPSLTNYMILNISGEEVADTLAFVEQVMRKVDPTHAFNFTFLDRSLNEQYSTELQLMKLIGLFAAICIFIACLGLFGLAAFTTEQRTREIGTRKVLGATTLQIILLLSKRILILVLVASVLASVAAYFAMDEWLAGFAYRAAISPLAFLIAATVAAAVAFTTVALQSFKTAHADPVQSLRHV